MRNVRDLIWQQFLNLFDKLGVFCVSDQIIAQMMRRSVKWVGKKDAFGYTEGE
jgi:hypothetical protein